MLGLNLFNVVKYANNVIRIPLKGCRALNAPILINATIQERVMVSEAKTIQSIHSSHTPCQRFINTRETNNIAHHSCGLHHFNEPNIQSFNVLG